MAYRLIALDLDGTTLDSRREIRPATKTVLAEARSRGIEVILVSGRHHGAIRPYHRELELDTPAICCNGAYVYDFASRRPVVGSAIDKGTASALLALCRRRGLHTLIYADDDMAYEERSAHLDKLIAWGESVPEELRPSFRRVARFEDVIERAESIWKFLVSSADRASTDAVADEMRDVGPLSLERSWSDRLDVVSGGNTKGGRLEAWSLSRGIAPSQIVAFGDNQNDIDMLRFAGLGVAMGGAEPEVAAAADVQADDCDTDAIADTLRRLVFRAGV